MATTVFNFTLVIRDTDIIGGKEVFAIPEKGDPRRLPQAEARHALAFLGLVPSQAVSVEPKLVIAGSGRIYNRRDVNSLSRSTRAHTVMRILYEAGDFMRCKDVIAQANMPKGTTSSILAQLKSINCVETNGLSPAKYRITPTGLDIFADALTTPQIAAQ